jgi:DNA-binding transcriptional LysR family regulator
MKQLQTSLPGIISAVQAADSGSFTAAAKVLERTPAAVSKSVAALESMLKIRLFNRTTRQLSLTEEGRAFIAHAREALNALEFASLDATRHLKARGTVRLSCAVGFGRRYVLPLLPAFYAAHPDVVIDLSLNDQKVDLIKEGFDVGIRGGSQPPVGMVARKICALDSVLVATPRYLKVRGTPKHFRELTEHDLLRVKFLSGRLAPWLFRDKGKEVAFEAKAKLLISDPEIIMDAALLHMGIARMGRHHAFDALQRGELIEVLPKQNVSNDSIMAIFYPHRAGLAPRVRVLVEFLISQFAEQPALR